MIKFDDKIVDLVQQAEQECKDKFKEIEKIEFLNQTRVLDIFRECKVESRHFIGSTGYGHEDIGKEKLSEVFANIFHTEDAFVSALISCGTEAISQTLLGILRPKDNMLVISGTPYDTLKTIIYGVQGKNVGSLKDYDIGYNEVEMSNGDFDINEIKSAIIKYSPKMIYIQRSRGYALRNAISIAQIERVIKAIKPITNACIVVDNCYGEFTEEKEPTDVGADLVIGSLLKNMGGGFAPTGGYIAGKKELVELVVYKMTSPALGSDIGSYSPGYKSFFQGVFISPHVVAEAKKIVALTSVCLNKLGYKTIPNLNDNFSDIVCTILFNNKEKLKSFTRTIQYYSAVDSNSTIEEGEMDGYEDKIIMASGSFNQGSSIELSCDGPMREPFAGFMQGGLNYAHGKIALMKALETLI